VLSSLAVVSVYLLGRELFDRTVGLIAAALFAFQPWIVWLGMSGMSSDLPSAVLVPLFGMFLVRWLRTDRPSALVAAAACLGIANGFRYENWLFAAVFSVLVLIVAVSQWKQRVLSQQGAAAATVALILVNALPVGWMMASYVVLGDWLPAMHGINS
jgi:predicted membrane-bound mannosyltransferase